MKGEGGRDEEGGQHGGGGGRGGEGQGWQNEVGVAKVWGAGEGGHGAIMGGQPEGSSSPNFPPQSVPAACTAQGVGRLTTPPAKL